MRSFEGGLPGGSAFLAQPVDVLQHHDGGIHHHADGKGDAGQGYDVDGPTEGRHNDKGADDGNRDGQGDDQGRHTRSEEKEQDEGRQGSADIDVLFDQVDGGFNVVGLVVHLLQDQSGRGQDLMV